MKRIALFSTLTLTAACAPSEDGANTATLRMGLEVTAPAAFADTCGNTLDSARIVIREVELDSASEDDDLADDAEEAEDVEIGPYLIDLTGADFNGMLQQAFLEAAVPVGTYDELEFEVHKLEGDDARDAQAAGADPAGLGAMMDAGFSISITGTNATSGAFAFSSDLNEEQEREVQIVVGDAVDGIDNVNLSIDPSGWLVATGGGCLDPNDASNESEIEENIKLSIDVEEDDDEDGIEDSEDTEDGDELEGSEE